jgi:hypothetical protein
VEHTAPILNSEPEVRSAGYTPVVKCLVELYKLQSVGIGLPDVFLASENEGAEKFLTS